MYMGDLPATVGHPRDYFELHWVTLDCRGPLVIDATSDWGFFITVITQSHVIAGWDQHGIPEQGVVQRGVQVDARAWIGSGAFLYNCHIGEGAVVAAGTVVRSAEVKPWTMVAGNPARVIARFREGRWQYAGEKWTVLE